MRTSPLSLRSILSVSTIAIVILSMIAAGTLVALTTVLHRTTAAAASAVESIRLAQKAELELLLHERNTDPLVELDLEDRMRDDLSEARRFVTTPTEGRLLAEARSRFEALAASTAASDRQVQRQALTRALDALAKRNTAQARHAKETAETWDHIANVAGVTVAALLIAVAAVLIVWLRHRAFVPVLSLATAMERFGRGDSEARAELQGPAELRDMARRFNDLASALATRRQAQIAFLAGVAHDLRNPLSLLKLSADMLDPSAPLPPEPRIRQLIQRFRKQTLRLDRMIGDFLEIAKIEAGTLELAIDVHDARALVRDVVELFEDAIPAGRIVLSLPDEPLPVPCDRLRIEQVITNLVSNAIKYSPPESPVEIGAEAHGRELVLRVADHGIGISQEDQKSLFEPFHRVGLSKEAVPGVGLGLSVVRRIVTAHGGRIELESAPGAGSTFRVYLPRAADGQSQSPSASAQP